jgi:hypothetical protein
MRDSVESNKLDLRRYENTEYPTPLLKYRKSIRFSLHEQGLGRASIVAKG